MSSSPHISERMVEVAERDRLIPAARRVMRTKHFSRLTEEAYVRWMVRYVRFHGMRHPRTLGENEMREFLSYLAADQKVAASTQSQALAALLFLYVEVLRDPVPWIADVIRARRPKRLPDGRPILGHRVNDQRVLVQIDPGVQHIDILDECLTRYNLGKTSFGISSCCTCQARCLRYSSPLTSLKCNCEGAHSRAFLTIACR